jgi:hypothetical protein
MTAEIVGSLTLPHHADAVRAELLPSVHLDTTPGWILRLRAVFDKLLDTAGAWDRRGTSSHSSCAWTSR